MSPPSNRKGSEDDYFNDLNRSNSNESPEKDCQDDINGEDKRSTEGTEAVPRPKRIACVICRKRKLKCDGVKPSCGTCSRLGHTCVYDEVRRKSGPKRGYVKALEARLQQVETLLKTQDTQEPSPSATQPIFPENEQNGFLQNTSFVSTHEGINFAINNREGTTNMLDIPELYQSAAPQTDFTAIPEFGGSINFDDTMSWEMIGLGLDEPLPSQEIIDELENIYFAKVHTSGPMIHQGRYRASMNLAPHMRPPVCLRYIMWSLAALLSDQYGNLAELFYQRARKYIELDDMKGHGENAISVAHSQCWTLIGSYEFKLMYFPRAWMSTGKGIRLAQMMGLYRLDGVGLDVKQCLHPPRDWTEREERRRTFWMAFCQDRYASVGTGWPMIIEEKDIMTNLPTSEEAYNNCRPQETMSLKDAMHPSGAAGLSSFAAVVLMASLFGRNLVHLHRPDPDDREDDLNGEFWKRHRQIDNVLLNTALNLPNHLRLPNGVNDTNIVFVNMNIHTSTICLHQAAIFKAKKNRMSSTVTAESEMRCITAAAEIARIMRMVSHQDLTAMSPFMSFCLYVGARVFVQYLKKRSNDDNARTSLQFLVTAMRALLKKNPLTESFLIQLDVDLESCGIRDPHINSSRAPDGSMINRSPDSMFTQYNDSVSCSPLFEIRQSQAPGVPVQTSASPLFSPSKWPSADGTQALPDRRKSFISNTKNQYPTGIPEADALYGQTAFVTGRPSRDRMDSSDGPSPEMDLSPDNSGSGGLSSAGHPTPDSTNQPPSNPSFTPPATDSLGQDPHHKGGASNAAPFFYSENATAKEMGARLASQSIWMRSDDGSKAGTNPDNELRGGFPIRQEWDSTPYLQTGVTPQADEFGGLMDEMGWETLVAPEFDPRVQK